MAESFVQEAESILFEAIYLLDRGEATLPNTVPIMSELGTNILVLYGDVLLDNGKYKYAILAYEAALQVRDGHWLSGVQQPQIYKALKGMDYHALNRRLCDLTNENEV